LKKVVKRDMQIRRRGDKGRADVSKLRRILEQSMTRMRSWVSLLVIFTSRWHKFCI